MASPPTLAVQTRGAGSVIKVYRILGMTTAIQIGNDITPSSGIHIDSLDVFWDTNFVAQYANDLYLIYGPEVYKYNSGTGNWDAQSLSLPMGVSNNYRMHTGLYNVSIGGAPYLAAAFTDSGQTGTRILTFDGSTWSYSANILATTGVTYWARGLVYRNDLWFVTRSDEILQFNPQASSAAKYTVGANNNQPRCLFVFNNELYCTGMSGTTNASKTQLYKFSAGSFNFVKNLGTSVATGTPDLGTGNDDGGHVLFSDGTDLFALWAGQDDTSGLHGSFCVRLVWNGSSFTETDLTSTVLPSALRPGGGEIIARRRWLAQMDNEANPTSPGIYLWTQANDGSTWSTYKWNGIASEITALGSGLAYQIVPAQFAAGGGDRIWSSGELNAVIIGTAPVLGGEQISFKAYGDPGSSDKTVKLYYDSGEEAPITQASLMGSATGGSATRNGNQIENVDADGSTTYTLVHDAATDGLGAGDKETLMLRIEV